MPIAGHGNNGTPNQTSHGSDKRRMRSKLDGRLQDRPRHTSGLDALFPAPATREIRTRLGPSGVDAAKMNHSPDARGGGGLRQRGNSLVIDVVVGTLLITRNSGTRDHGRSSLTCSRERCAIGQVANHDLCTGDNSCRGIAHKRANRNARADESSRQSAADKTGRTSDQYGCIRHSRRLPRRIRTSIQCNRRG